MEQDEIVKRVRAEHPDAVVDIVGSDCNFELHIVSEGFAGQGCCNAKRASWR